MNSTVQQQKIEEKRAELCSIEKRQRYYQEEIEALEAEIRGKFAEIAKVRNEIQERRVTLTKLNIQANVRKEELQQMMGIAPKEEERETEEPNIGLEIRKGYGVFEVIKPEDGVAANKDVVIKGDIESVVSMLGEVYIRRGAQGTDNCRVRTVVYKLRSDKEIRAFIQAGRFGARMQEDVKRQVIKELKIINQLMMRDREGRTEGKVYMVVPKLLKKLVIDSVSHVYGLSSIGIIREFTGADEDTIVIEVITNPEGEDERALFDKGRQSMVRTLKIPGNSIIVANEFKGRNIGNVTTQDRGENKNLDKLNKHIKSINITIQPGRYVGKTQTNTTIDFINENPITIVDGVVADEYVELKGVTRFVQEDIERAVRKGSKIKIDGECMVYIQNKRNFRLQEVQYRGSVTDYLKTEIQKQKEGIGVLGVNTGEECCNISQRIIVLDDAKETVLRLKSQRDDMLVITTKVEEEDKREVLLKNNLVVQKCILCR